MPEKREIPEWGFEYRIPGQINAYLRYVFNMGFRPGGIENPASERIDFIDIISDDIHEKSGRYSGFAYTVEERIEVSGGTRLHRLTEAWYNLNKRESREIVSRKGSDSMA